MTQVPASKSLRRRVVLEKYRHYQLFDKEATMPPSRNGVINLLNSRSFQAFLSGLTVPSQGSKVETLADQCSHQDQLAATAA